MDYIERESAIKSLLNDAPEQVGYSREDAADCIRYMDAADVAPVVPGRIVGSLEDGRYRRSFPCCGEDATMITEWAWPKYCPNCGGQDDG